MRYFRGQGEWPLAVYDISAGRITLSARWASACAAPGPASKKLSPAFCCSQSSPSTGVVYVEHACHCSSACACLVLDVSMLDYCIGVLVQHAVLPSFGWQTHGGEGCPMHNVCPARSLPQQHLRNMQGGGSAPGSASRSARRRAALFVRHL